MLILLMVQCPELGDWFSSSPDIKTGAGGGEWIETMSRFILVLTFSIRKSDNITGDELGQAEINHDLVIHSTEKIDSWCATLCY